MGVLSELFLCAQPTKMSLRVKSIIHVFLNMSYVPIWLSCGPTILMYLFIPCLLNILPGAVCFGKW